MNAKRLLLLTAVCLTIGVTEAPAQGFLNKLKKKGMKIIKDAVPNPVKDVTDAASNPERVVNRAKATADAPEPRRPIVPLLASDAR